MENNPFYFEKAPTAEQVWAAGMATYKQMRKNERIAKEEFKELRALMKENAEHLKETERALSERFEETDHMLKETGRLINMNAERIKALDTKFFSQAGHIIEGLMEPSAMRLFKEAGYDIDRCTKNYKRHIKATGRKAEYDVILLDDTIAIVVEVKINCTKADVDHFIVQMGMFRELFPEAANKEVMGAIAAVNYDRESDIYAHDEGLFVIRVHDDDIFTLDRSDKAELRRF